MFELVDGKLSMPKGMGGGSVTFDLTEINYAEKRIPDISIINPAVGPEMMSLFNNACSTMSKYVAVAAYELERATTCSKRIRARVLLDKVPDEIQKRGLSTGRSTSGSEDQRSAIVELDAEYQDAVDRMAAIRAVFNLFEGKLESLKMAFYSSKQLSPNFTSQRNPLEGVHNG